MQIISLQNMNNSIPQKGILGLGKESTLYYLDQIQTRYQLQNKTFSTCPYLLYQIDFQEINPFLPDHFSELIPKLEAYLNQISNLGITKLLIPNITLHQTLDQTKCDLEICHPVILTAKYLQEQSIFKATLFGTHYTMNSAYLKEKFSDSQVEIILPSLEDQLWIDEFRSNVYLKNETEKDIAEFQKIIQKYSSDYPVIIGCTELSIYSPKNNPNCIDMADVQIDEFLK